MSKRGHEILVVGVGNAFRGDDAVGLAVIDALHPLDGLRAVCAKHGGEGASLIDLWQGFEHVILIDAVRSAQAPGTVHFLDTSKQTVPTRWFHYSSHAFGVAEAVELARILGTLPTALHIIGVEGADFTLGSPLTAAVADQIIPLCALVRHDMDCLCRGVPLEWEHPSYA